MATAVIVGMGPGLSAAVARRFGREGFAIAAIARRADALDQQIASLGARGVKATAYTADAADSVGLRSVLERASSAHGGIDVLIYNAAGVRLKPLSELTAEELTADFKVSVAGALTAAQTVLPAMKARRSGTLLFTGGGFAFEPAPQLAVVGVGKAAIRNLAFSLFADLHDTGVHAATVTVGGTVKAGSAFDPDEIAEVYWQLHTQPRGHFEREIVFKGNPRAST